MFIGRLQTKISSNALKLIQSTLAIPESPEHLASYEEVILRTEEFHEYIVNIR